MIFKAQACGGGEPPHKAGGGRGGRGVGNIDPIHNFGTHFLCTKGYGILGEKGGGVPYLWSTFLECFWKVLYFPFLFLKEVSGEGPGKDLKASLKVTLPKPWFIV